VWSRAIENSAIVREQLLSGTYKPKLVRRMEIPKPERAAPSVPPPAAEASGGRRTLSPAERATLREVFSRGHLADSIAARLLFERAAQDGAPGSLATGTNKKEEPGGAQLAAQPSRREFWRLLRIGYFVALLILTIVFAFKEEINAEITLTIKETATKVQNSLRAVDPFVILRNFRPDWMIERMAASKDACRPNPTLYRHHPLDSLRGAPFNQSYQSYEEDPLRSFYGKDPLRLRPEWCDHSVLGDLYAEWKKDGWLGLILFGLAWPFTYLIMTDNLKSNRGPGTVLHSLIWCGLLVFILRWILIGLIFLFGFAIGLFVWAGIALEYFMHARHIHHAWVELRESFRRAK
jgi:hypothetical protein